MKALLEPIIKNPKVGIPAAILVLLISAMGPGKVAIEWLIARQNQKEWARSDDVLLVGSINNLLNGSNTKVWLYQNDSLSCFTESTCKGEFLNYQPQSILKWRNNECTKEFRNDKEIHYCPILKDQVFWGLASGVSRASVLSDSGSISQYLSSKPVH